MSRKSKAERRAMKDRWQRTLRPETVETWPEDGGGTPRVYRDPFSVPDGAICSQCKARAATSTYTNSGMIGAIHGDYDYRCNLCILAAQYTHIQEQLTRLAEVEAGIAEGVSAMAPREGAYVKIQPDRYGKVLRTAWEIQQTPGPYGDRILRVRVMVEFDDGSEPAWFDAGDLEVLA